MAASVSFAGNSLQTSSIVTNDVQHDPQPTKNAALVALAHANTSVIPYINYPSKQFPLTGRITGSTIAACEALIDTFKSYFNTQDGNLDIDYAGATRRYIATATDIQVPRLRGLAYADFTVMMTCTVPWGLDTSTTTALSATGRTSGSYTDSHTFVGSAPFQAPVFTITLTAVTGGSSATVTVGNNSTGQAISVTRNWAASDVLVVDCAAKKPTVTVNGTVVAYTGAFPYFPTGSGSLTYADSFTTRTFNESVVYTARYL